MFYSDGNQIYSEEELSLMVFNTVKYYAEQNERLLKENKDLREKGKEMADSALKQINNRLAERIKLSYGEFASEKEQEAYNQFEQEHIHDRLTSKYNGGRAPYLIPTHTGVGTLLKVVCPICGESKDITDVETW